MKLSTVQKSEILAALFVAILVASLFTRGCEQEFRSEDYNPPVSITK